MRTFIILAVLLTLTAASCNKGGDAPTTDESTTTAPPPEATGPSILLITLDTTRADRLGAYGNTLGASPHLDALAAEGVTFRRAFCHTPLTIPSHVTMFTGQYPDRHGVRDNGDHFLSDEALTVAERFEAAGYQTVASVGAYVTNRKWGFGQGFDEYNDYIPANYELGGNLWQSERRADAVVADMVTWLEAHADQRFFGWVHLFDPHHPYAPPPPYDEKFPRRPYLGEVAYTDAQIGALIAELDAMGRLDDTTIVVAGDHGESFGNHNEHQHGLFVYNATVHVPFIVRPAGGMEPRMVEEAVGLVDLAPTLLALAEIDAPDAAESFDGIDLSGALRGEDPPRRTLYGESLYVRNHFGWSEQRMVIEWPYKYIGSTRPELFDIQEDPREKEDLLATLPEVEKRLAGVLGARPAIDSSSTTSTVDPETAARLEALGYVATRVEVDADAVLPDPKDKTEVLASFARGNMAMRTGHLSEARELFEKIVAEEPQLIDPRATLTQICIRLGDPEAALEQVVEADRRAPGKSNILGLHAWALVAAGRTDEGLEKLEQALAIDDQQARTWSRMLQILFENRRYPEVVEMARRAEEILPGVPSVAGYHGAALVAMNRYEEARALLNQALSGGNNPPWANFAMGVLADADGDSEASLGHFMAEHGAFPEHMEALFSTVIQLERMGRSEDVLEYSQKALAANTGHPEMQRAHGQALFNLQRFDESYEQTQTCLATNPDHAGCTMLLANVLAKLGRRAEAEEAFERAKELGREQAPPGVIIEGRRVD